MSKRKLEHLDDPVQAFDNKVTKRKHQLQPMLEGVLNNGKKALYQALRISKKLERQKLGRRQKNAKKENAPSEVARLAGEVHALKTLNFSAVAEAHLYKSLLKIKPISESPAFLSNAAATLVQTTENTDTATVNVTARLCGANPVKTALADVITNVEKKLKIGTSETRKKKRLRATDYTDKSCVEKSNEDVSIVAESRPEIAGDSEDENQDQRRNPVKDSAEPDSSSESIDYCKYQSRLAESDDEFQGFSTAEESQNGMSITGEEAPSSHSKHLQPDDVAAPVRYHLTPSLSPSPTSSSTSSFLNKPHHTNPISTTESPIRYHLARSLSPSASPSIISSPSDKPPDIDRPKSIPTSKTPTKQTTFLPSLIGGYWSGSESAPEDDDPSTIKPRKNRRGQQERRAIWEKKYGRGAKHIQGQLHAPQRDRDEGWDTRRGASDGRGKRGRGRGGIRGGRGGIGARPPMKVASGANDESVSNKRVMGRGAKAEGRQRDDGPLHPSWEAKKKAKEKAGSSNVAFQGKKVVFD